jgi:imidazolonepropionase-like amidohydrolase
MNDNGRQILMRKFLALAALAALSFACGEQAPPKLEGVKAFTGATLFDGHDAVIPNATLIVRDGRVDEVGASAVVKVPEGAETVDLSGKFVTPGWINGHGHVGGAQGLKTGPEVYTKENLISQLQLYAHYGVTTVLSLGGDGAEAIALRDAQDAVGLDRARVYVAGEIVVGPTIEEAQAQVDKNAQMGVDIIKIRVDPTIGDVGKISPELYTAIIERAHSHNLPVAAHLYYLKDAKGLLDAGVDYIAHSIRDQPVDDELIAKLKEKNVCLCPTLTREVSTFVYESTPEFFSDPFFLKYADPKVLEELKNPERQKGVREGKGNAQNKKNLVVASENLKKLADAGVTIVMGTDTGPPARFQGYFEHMELDLMAKAGLSPEQILRSATGDASKCLKMASVGVLEKGRWADFNVFGQDLMAGINGSKSLESVWIGGERLAD